MHKKEMDMKKIALLALVLFLLPSVGFSDDQNRTKAQIVETDRQLKISAKQLKIYDAQLKRAEKQADRWERLLKRWERQADRYDALLDKWERQANSQTR